MDKQEIKARLYDIQNNLQTLQQEGQKLVQELKQIEDKEDGKETK